MELYIDAFYKLKESILGNDFLMLIAMAFTTICLVGTLLQKRNFRKYIQKNEDIKGDLHALHYHKSLRRWYSIFLTMISVFPLLGMLGTVVGLLGLDLTSGDMENISQFLYCININGMGNYSIGVFQNCQCFYFWWCWRKDWVGKKYGRRTI